MLLENLFFPSNENYMQINYWAVLVCSVVAMGIGSVWFGPLFGKKYMSAVGMDKWSEEEKAKMKKSMLPTYFYQFVASYVSFYALAWFMNVSGLVDVAGGLAVAFFIWIGFVVPLKLGDALWGGKMTLFWLGVGGNLLSMLAAGMILGLWR
jgi:hypothetical protein